MGIDRVNNNEYVNILTTTNTVKNSTNTEEDTKTSAASEFKNAVEEMIETNKITTNKIKKEDDWREMSDKEWDKLVEHIDQYIDDHKKELEEMKKVQEEAAMKMAAQAPANMRTIAASNAALKVAVQTDDQAILDTAKIANEYATDMMSKSQELAITDTTTTGITSTSDVKECASVDEDDKDRIWTITAFSQDGITCTRGKAGEMEELWSIKYENPGDYKKVWDFLDRFDKDADLKFAGNKDFWESFLTGRISSDEYDTLVKSINANTGFVREELLSGEHIKREA